MEDGLPGQSAMAVMRGQCEVGTGPGVPHVTSVCSGPPYTLEGALDLINY